MHRRCQPKRKCIQRQFAPLDVCSKCSSINLDCVSSFFFTRTILSPMFLVLLNKTKEKRNMTFVGHFSGFSTLLRQLSKTVAAPRVLSNSSFKKETRWAGNWPATTYLCRAPFFTNWSVYVLRNKKRKRKEALKAIGPIISSFALQRIPSFGDSSSFRVCLTLMAATAHIFHVYFWTDGQRSTPT